MALINVHVGEVLIVRPQAKPTHGDIIRFAPPLVISEAGLQKGLSIIAAAIKDPPTDCSKGRESLNETSFSNSDCAVLLNRAVNRMEQNVVSSGTSQGWEVPSQS